MNIKKLDWDSTFFGLRIGRCDILSAEDSLLLASQKESLQKKFDLIYVFAIHSLDFHAVNAKLVDRKVVYSLSDASFSKENHNVVLWNCNDGVTDELRHLALVSGKYSRFKLDEQFPLGSYEHLYSRWIEQSVNHVMASEVFCYMVDGFPRGLVTLDNKSGLGTIGLVAIHEDYQRKGIGTAMIRHVIGFSQKQHFLDLSVATQLDNIPACSLYEKNGFEKKSTTNIWHWWL